MEYISQISRHIGQGTDELNWQSYLTTILGENSVLWKFLSYPTYSNIQVIQVPGTRTFIAGNHSRPKRFSIGSPNLKAHADLKAHTGVPLPAKFP